MKTKSIKSASYNELEEIASFCSSLERTIEQYSHILEFMPDHMVGSIQKFHAKALEELEKIDNES
jgi:hypothetical protein